MKNSWLITFLPFLLTGCSAPKEVASPRDHVEGEHALSWFLLDDDHAKVSYSFDVSYFDEDATTMNESLMMLSFIRSSIDRYQKNKTFYENLDFENIYYSPGYETHHEALSMGHCFAARPMNGYYLISVGFESYNYEKEWADNFYIGESGDQYSYSKVCKDINRALESYLEPYKGYKTKFWITGYSRGGSLAGMLSKEIIDSGLFGAKKEDCFTYTFESPCSVASKGNYPNVHNFLNREDLIPQLLPQEYGFARPGNEYYIDNSEHLEEYLAELDPTVEHIDYVGNNTCPTLASLCKSIMDLLLSSFPIEADFSLETRADYVKNMQPYAVRLMEHLFADGQEGFQRFTKVLQGFDFSSAIPALFSEEKFYQLFKGLLDESQIPYEEKALRECIDGWYRIVNKFYTYHLSDIFQLLPSLRNNAPLLVRNHFPDITYAYLRHFQK